MKKKKKKTINKHTDESIRNQKEWTLNLMTDTRVYRKREQKQLEWNAKHDLNDTRVYCKR